MRVLVALALPTLTGLGTLSVHHDEVHRDGVSAEHRIARAASHADESGHVEGAGELESATCFTCLLRLPNSGTLRPPARIDGLLASTQRALSPLRGSLKQQASNRIPSRGPPLF